MSFLDIFKTSKYKQEISELQSANAALQQKLSELGADNYYAVLEKTNQLQADYDDKSKTLQENYDTEQKRLQSILRSLQRQADSLSEQVNELAEKNQKTEKQLISNQKKLSRIKELYLSAQNAVDNFTNLELGYAQCKIPQPQFDEMELLAPSITLKLHCMDVKDLKKAYRENDKKISKLMDSYSSRYTTKANRTIYQLMVIALRAELQNILYNLKYEKLEQSVENVKAITVKYSKLAVEGNQSIAGTLTKFIGEIEYLFINSVKIEYNYYVKREQAKQEQMAIREQIRQEAAERKALEEERKRIEKEESKYNSEIDKLKEQLAAANEEELQKLNARILQLQSQLSDIAIKKTDIANLQNGKAGNIYIISNLGSLGEDVFKVGMTRRLNPQDRIDELSNASVPFKFDVHSFIFSDDAVSLEKRLHTILNDKRVNKVNLRKEFFRVSVDELEQLVSEIEPTAEFNKTMLAEEFRQSLSSDELYTSEYHDDFIDDEE